MERYNLLQYIPVSLLYTLASLNFPSHLCIPLSLLTSAYHPPPHLPHPQDTLQPLSMQALPAPPESLCIVEMGGGGEGERGLGSVGGLFLNIGLQNGVLLKTALDSITGDLSDTRTR